MTNLLLHIGTHKTGTTAVQQSLSQAQSRLEEHGILYPKSGRQVHLPDCHHSLAWGLSGSRNTTMAPWDDLFKEIEQSDAKRIVVSSEEFSLCKEREVNHLAEIVHDYDVRILLYLRNPLKFLVSYYKQLVKRNIFRGSFHSFIRSPLSKYGDYLPLVSRWMSSFGKDRVVVRLYDEAKLGSGVVPDFFMQLQIEMQQLCSSSTPSLNISPTDGALRVIRGGDYLEYGLRRIKHGVGTDLGLARCVGALRRRLYQSEVANSFLGSVNAAVGLGPLYSPQDLESLREKWWKENGRLFGTIVSEDGKRFFLF